MDILLNNAETISMTPRELVQYTIGVVEAHIAEQSRDFVSKGEAMQILGIKRAALEKYVSQGILEPTKGDRNQKWAIPLSQVLSIKRLKCTDNIHKK